MSDLTKKPTADQVRRLPKALLHDHLDGGLRPQTIIDIAKEIGHELPTYDPAELAEWFRSSCDSGSLVLYLETFAHTVAVMQRKKILSASHANAPLILPVMALSMQKFAWHPNS